MEKKVNNNKKTKYKGIIQDDQISMKRHTSDYRNKVRHNTGI